MSYVDGWAINILLVYIFIFWHLNTLKQKHAICWRLSHQHMTYEWFATCKSQTTGLCVLTYLTNDTLSIISGPALYFFTIYLYRSKHVICWAEPSTYDMFAFLKKNSYVDGSTVNIWHVFMLVSEKINKMLSYVDGSAVNIWQLSNLSYVDSWAINTWLVYILKFWNLNS